MAASWRPLSCWAVDAEPGTLVARAKVGFGSVKKGQVGGVVAGSRRLWWGGAVLAAFVLRFVLFFDFVVDVPVVLVVFWCLVRYCARQGMWSRQCCPWCSAVAVLGPGGDMPVVSTTGAVLGHG